ncbi:MAG: HlyC/CorC family transporter [Acidimicrobiales bacterium]|jgi:CBS domain containing-hemolysin-like protein|nr:HlyC/CorC family transporter [Acidimicrobiales bacterium]
MGTAARLALVIAVLGANAFFVAIEFALVAVDRVAIEADAQAGRRGARVASGLLSELSFHLSAAQIGITVSSLLLGFIAEPVIGQLLAPLLGTEADHESGLAVLIALFVATVSQMVLGELIPKNVALARAHRSILRLAPVVRVYGVLASPLVKLLNGSANALLRRMGIEPREELATTRTIEELRIVIEAAADEGALDEGARDLLERSIRFAGKTAADALVPRGDVVALHRDATVADLVALSVSSGHSRFPVYGSGPDDVVGIARVQRVYGIDPAARATTSVLALVEDAFILPESRSLDRVLVDLAATGRQLAVVVDEHGGTAGILTVEDVVEEIVGDIVDEHDPNLRPLVELASDGWVLDGRLHRDEVADATGYDLPDGDYETLAGFLLARFGRIPAIGDRIELDGWGFEVTDLDRLRVAQVRVSPPAPGGDDPAGPTPRGGRP